jgi:tetratricopeptide (TPR) repeat protein
MPTDTSPVFTIDRALLRAVGLISAAAVALSACAAPPATPRPGATDAAAAIGPQPAGTPNLATPNAQAQSHLDAARAAIGARDYAKAITAAQEAVKADGGASATHYLLGNAYNQAASVEADPAKRADYFNRAIASYQQAIAINSNNGDARHNLGTVFLQIGQNEQARAQFEAALAVDPNDAKTHYMLGTIYLQDDPTRSPQSSARAQSEFETALKQAPDLAEAYIGLAQVYLNKGDAAKALENAKKGVDMSAPNVDPYSYWQLAQAQCATGDKAGGADTLRKVVAAQVPDPNFNQQVQQLIATCK